MSTLKDFSKGYAANPNPDVSRAAVEAVLFFNVCATLTGPGGVQWLRGIPDPDGRFDCVQITRAKNLVGSQHMVTVFNHAGEEKLRKLFDEFEAAASFYARQVASVLMIDNQLFQYKPE